MIFLKNKYKPSGGKMAAQVASQKERLQDRDAGNKSSVSKTEAWRDRAERALSQCRRGQRGQILQGIKWYLRGENRF